MMTKQEADKELRNQARNFRTKVRGDDDAEYLIYVDCAESLGWKVKTYQEWLGS